MPRITRSRVAPQTFFRVTNLKQARTLFLASDTSQPVFTYAPYDTSLLYQQLSVLDQERVRERQSLELIIASEELRANPTAQAIERYRALNQDLYGVPSKQDAIAILNRAVKKSPSNHDSFQLGKYILSSFGQLPEGATLYRPSNAIFQLLRSYLMRYVDIETLIGLDNKGLISMIEFALTQSGCHSDGWRVEGSDDMRHASTVHGKKVIYIGKNYRPRTKISKLKIVLHEVYGHALRGPQDTVHESEGFATMLEQLVHDRYVTKRSYRLLASALGWGVMGEPMDFRSVFEILWRTMVQGNRYNENEAKKHAFLECVRVFRGGMPGVPGTVFLKDAIYYRANVDMWKALEASPPSYQDFVNIIEGRKKILS